MSSAKTLAADTRFLDRWTLLRRPAGGDPTLRAWDAADEYVVRHLDAQARPADPGSGNREARRPSALILNDRFGALALALAELGYGVVSVSDSWLSLEGAKENVRRNHVSAESIRWLPSTAAAWADATSVDLLVVKVPRALAFLDAQLSRAAAFLGEGAAVIGAGMSREVHASTLETFERRIGTTTTSRAVKKARLIFAQPDADDTKAEPCLQRWSAFGVETVNGPNVFSAGRLDRGTALLLEALEKALEKATKAEAADSVSEAPDVIDVGCGNGLLGTWYAKHHPGARVRFRDDSFDAVSSAEATFRANLPGRAADFETGDALEGTEPASADVVLINPPFHAQGARGDDTAWRMFSGAGRVLRRGGVAWVVGNRHLDHAAKLKRIFREARVIHADPKFVVVRAIH